MKKVICLALFALLFGACKEQNHTQTQQVAVQDTTQNSSGIQYNVMRGNVDIRRHTIDGHDYIVVVSVSTNMCPTGGVSIIHSEGCKCHKTQYNKEHRE